MNRLIFSFCLSASLLIVSTSTAQKTATPPPDTGDRRDMGDLLIQGLKQIDGCLAVKTCEWNDGKQSIVAWFKNKEAAVEWYYSDTHQGLIGTKTEQDQEYHEPMEHVDDEAQPVMVIATLTPSDQPELPGMKIPISQISIELFAALPGGAHISGRVSPETFRVPHMRDYTAESAAAGNH